jgi:hypothetical protein
MASSPGLSRRSRSGWQVPDYRDGRDKPGHDQNGLPRVLVCYQHKTNKHSLP